MKKSLLFALMALTGALLFTGCSNDDLTGRDNYISYEYNFQKVLGKVNPNQNFNSQRAVGIDVSVVNTQGNYTLRVFSAMPGAKGAALLGKFENLNAGQVASVRVDVHKAAKNIYCMVDDGVSNVIKPVAIPTSGKASVKFDGIADSRSKGTRADTGETTTTIMTDDDLFDPNSATIAFEDLGSSDDFDFNDAVIKVEYVTGTEKIKVTLMAVGAVLPLKLYYLQNQDEYIVRSAGDNNELVPLFDGEELHAVMGYSNVKTIINTNWKTKGDIVGVDEVEFVSCEIDAPLFFSLSDEGFPFVLEVNGNSDEQRRITTNNYGAVPQVLVISGYLEEPDIPQPQSVTTPALGDEVDDEPEFYYNSAWRWPKEKTSILDAYTNIQTWIEDDPYDYSFLNEGVADDKLYDGYNPFASYEDEGTIELEAVDLGLTSGTLWANMNVGATAPEKAGGYYSWGEITEKDSYSRDTYLYYDDPFFYSFGDISGSEHDVANAVIGGDWVMPTLEQYEELFDECEVEYTSRKGFPGYKLTGPNGNSIFFPITGYYEDNKLFGFGSVFYYWTSSVNPDYDPEDYNNDGGVFSAFMYGINFESSKDSPYFGQSVRAVISPSVGLQAVDLGLPSRTLWANMNVGANAPEDYGNYYAWGETEMKQTYKWSTYIHCDGTNDTCHDLGSDIAGTEYDVAHVLWGGDWVMPTLEQIQELIDNTTSMWTKFKGVNGRKFTSKATGNTNSIFLPAAGTYWFAGLDDAGKLGYYWSSTHYASTNPSYNVYAHELYFGSDKVEGGKHNFQRMLGFTVRPVSK